MLYYARIGNAKIDRFACAKQAGSVSALKRCFLYQIQAINLQIYFHKGTKTQRKIEILNLSLHSLRPFASLREQIQEKGSCPKIW